ncbi:MAG: hypothetical protein AB7E74_08765 [Pirellulales bacterium]
MADPPKRPWFCFRISTVLILTAIVAWAMAQSPRRTSGFVFLSRSTDPAAKWEVEEVFKFPRSKEEFAPWHRWIRAKKRLVSEAMRSRGPNGKHYWIEHRIATNRLFLAPYFALAAFLAWKAAWAVGLRLVRRRMARAAE